jgi:hypothetical protein
MALLDWILVAFGAAVTLTGGWIVLRPERVVSHWSGQTRGWQLDSGALAQIRRLGSCFVFMGMFFAVQMTVDLTQLPWWTGTAGGLTASIASVILVNARVRRQQRRRGPVRQSPLPAKALELR